MRAVVALTAIGAVSGARSADADAETRAGGVAASSPPRLVATPSTCVALHRGQVCYVDVGLSWSALGPGRWCLEREDGPRLVCWHGAERTAHEHGYASASAERYRLVRAADGGSVATAEVRTAWVYRTGRRSASGWRLF